MNPLKVIGNSVALPSGAYGYSSSQADSLFQAGLSPRAKVTFALGQRLTNLDVAATTWGKPIPVTWGRRRIQGEVVFATGLRERAEASSIMRLSYQADIARPKFRVSLDFKYSVGCAIFSFGYAPASNVTRQLQRLWANGTVIYDRSAHYVYPGLRMRFHPALEDENPDAAYIRVKGANAVSFRGQMVVVLENLAVGAFGNALPTVTAEIGEDAVNANLFTPFTSFNDADANTTSVIGFWNWGTRRYYRYLSDTNTWHEYDLETDQQVGIYPTSGNPYSGPLGISPWPGAFMPWADLAFVNPQGASNSTPILCVDVTAGQVKSTWGVFNNGLSNTDTAIVLTFDGATCAPDEEARRKGIVGYLTTFGFNGEWYVFSVTKAGVLTPVKYGDLGVGTEYAVGSSNRPEVFFKANNTQVGKLKISNTGVVITSNWVTLPATATIQGLYLSQSQDCVLVFYSDTAAPLAADKRWCRRVDTLTGATDWELPVYAQGISSVIENARQANDEGGTFGSAFFSDGWVIDIATGSSYEVGGLNGGTFWDGRTERFYSPNKPGYWTFNEAAGNRLSLASFLKDLCIYAGYQSSDVTVTGVNDFIDGAWLVGRYDLRQMLKDICRLYRIEMVESDGKLWFQRKDRSAGPLIIDQEIQSDDLAWVNESDGDDRAALVINRTKEADVPYKITLKYIDPDYDYQDAEYSWQRPRGSNSSAREDVIAVPIVMKKSEAVKLVNTLLYDVWAGRVTTSIRLGPGFGFLNPGDVIAINHQGYRDVIKIKQTTHNADWSVSIEGETVLTEAGIEITVDPNDPFRTPLIRPADAVFYMFDHSLLFDTDQVVGSATLYYFLAPKYDADNWPGGNVFKDFGGGASSVLFPTGVQVARCLTALSAPGAAVFQLDTRSNLELIFPNGINPLTSTDQLSMLGGANRAIIGKNGQWEVIGYQDVSYDPVTKKVTLTNFIRGCRGTEIFADLHTGGGEVFIPLNAANLAALQRDFIGTGTIGQTGAWVGLGLGQPELGATEIEKVFDAGSFRPWAVWNVKAVTSGSDIVLSWDRRTKLDNPLESGAAVDLLEEATEKYELEILTVDGTLKRTVTDITTPQYTYTNANLTADGFSLPLAQLRVKVYQVSSVAGRGYTRDLILNVQ